MKKNEKRTENNKDYLEEAWKKVQFLDKNEQI